MNIIELRLPHPRIHFLGVQSAHIQIKSAQQTLFEAGYEVEDCNNDWNIYLKKCDEWSLTQNSVLKKKKREKQKMWL